MFQLSIVREPEADALLVQMGLSRESLRQVVRVSDSSRLMCTRHHPKITPGFNAWSEGVREFRDIYVPLGWTANSTQNFETTISPSGDFAVCVASGSVGTGTPGQSPKIRPRGPLTQAVVIRNSRQLQFDLGFDTLSEEHPDKLPMTWFLLMYAYEEKVYCELSLPRGMSARGQVLDWSKRILLEPIVRGPQATITPADGEPDINIDIIRKRAQ